MGPMSTNYHKTESNLSKSTSGDIYRLCYNVNLLARFKKIQTKNKKEDSDIRRDQAI
jgi:hypothetical protein